MKKQHLQIRGVQIYLTINHTMQTKQEMNKNKISEHTHTKCLCKQSADRQT